MPSLTSELIVRLLDGVTKPAAAIAKSLKGIDRAQDEVNKRSIGQKLADASAANARELDAMRGKMLDAAAAGYALQRAISAPLEAATKFETQLEDIGQKADIPREELGALGAEIKKIGAQTNQASSEIAKSVDTLVGMGASKEIAMAAAGPIGQAATAYRAATEDLAAASFAAVQNLKVPSKDIGSAIDAMAEAGKRGAFELRDMAQYFPSLGAAYQRYGANGVKGVADLAAALQVVRKGTGDASSAATNLQNVLQKIYAPATVKKFRKHGVDIFKEMAAAAKAGKSPIEAIAEITNKALKGNLTRLGDIFEDSQVQQGLTAIIQNLNEYREIRDAAMKSQGVVAKDYERRMQTAAQASARWKILTENLSIAIGSALLPALNDTVSALSPAILAMTNFAETNPKLTRAVVSATTAVVGLRVASIAARWGFLFMKGGALDLAGGLVAMGAGIARSVTSLALLRGALSLLKVALIGTGIGAALVAIGAAGAFIYNNWSGITQMFDSFGTAFMAALGPARGVIDPVIEGMKTLYGWFESVTGQVDPSGEKWKSWGTSLGTSVGGALKEVISTGQYFKDNWRQIWADAVTGSQSYLPKLTAFGESITGALRSIDWSGIRTTLKTNIEDIGNNISSYIGSIDWAGVGASLSTNVIGIYTAMANAIRAINWKDLGVEIGAAIRNVFITGVEITTAVLEAGAKVAKSLWDGITTGTSNMDWVSIGNSVLNFLGAAITAGTDLFAGIVQGLFHVDLKEVAVSTVNSFIDGCKQILTEFAAWVRAKLASAFDIRGYVTSMFGGNTPTTAPPTPANSNAPPMQARATGGPVRAGQHYVVGDGGEPEVFSPGQNGFITPFSKLQPIGADGAGGRGRQASVARSAPRIEYKPQFNFGPVNGVPDFEQKMKEAEERMYRDFETLIAGQFSDQGAA